MSFGISRGKRSNWSRTALLKCLSKVGQFMAGRFRKDMLGSWSIESSQDGKTSTWRSLEVMEKRNSDMPCTHGSVGTSGTYDWPDYISPIHQLPAPSPQIHQLLKEVPLWLQKGLPLWHQKGVPLQLQDHHQHRKGVRVQLQDQH